MISNNELKIELFPENKPISELGKESVEKIINKETLAHSFDINQKNQRKKKQKNNNKYQLRMIKIKILSHNRPHLEILIYLEIFLVEVAQPLLLIKIMQEMQEMIYLVC